MMARDYWKAVTVDRSDLLDRFLAVLRERGTRFCVVGGQGVNAYADPVVSLDLDIVVASPDVARLWQRRRG
jgi:acetolactate synthase regulatory subunit